MQATQGDSGGYVQVESGAQGKEAISAGPLVASAYGFLWLVVMLFVWRTAKRATQIDKELHELKRTRAPAPDQAATKG